MRLALIADIHGNFTALQAVLADIRRESIGSIIFLGDLVTGGPQPCEVIAELQKINCPCILGNHESALLDPGAALRFQIAPPLIPSLHWTLGQLTSADLDYLRGFKASLEVPLPGEAALLCFHGSPLSNTDLLQAMTPADDVAEMLANCRAKFFAGGHTHVQMLRQHNGTLIINPGSVGQPFRSVAMRGEPPTLLPWAEYAIVNSANGALSVDLRRIPFDLKEYTRAISASELPMKPTLLQQYANATQ